MTADPYLRPERVAERTVLAEAWVAHTRRILRGEAPVGSYPDGPVPPADACLELDVSVSDPGF